MPREIRHFTATIPAGTPVLTPVTINIGFSPRVVRWVDWRIPPGAQGTMGWQLAMGGIQVVPVLSDKWVIDDGISGTFTTDGYPDSGAWQVVGYNTGAFAHSVYLVFHLDLVERPRRMPAPLPGAALAPVTDLSQLGAPVRVRR